MENSIKVKLKIYLSHLLFLKIFFILELDIFIKQNRLMSIKLLVRKLIHPWNLDRKIFLWYTNETNESECDEQAMIREDSLSFGKFVWF